MKNNFWIFVPVAVLLSWELLSSPSFAQGINVNYNYATFMYDSTQTFMELYYSFNPGTLHFTKSAAHDSSAQFPFTDSLLFDVSIGDGNTIVAHQAWKAPVNVPDTAQQDLRKNLVGKVDFALKPGRYKLTAYCIDMDDSLSKDSFASDILVPSYKSDRLEASSIELCSRITQGNKSSIFYKNTYDVIPNPTSLFGQGMPIIYYYLEVYNIPGGPADSLFTAGYEVRDSYGQVKKTSFGTRKKFGTSSVEVGTVNGSDLKTGTYTLLYTVVDSAADSYTTSSRKFFVYNPGLGKPEVPDSGIMSKALLSSIFATMGEQQVNKEFAEARYIATSSERSQFNALTTVESKREFLYEFWTKRNTRIDSKTDDIRIQYLERVAYANDHFRAGMREGWQTDRGRVYILYGTPDEIDRHPNETDSKPYEIWYYNSLEGGVSFDFVDRTGFGDYSLVNSTERNEIHDDNWQQYLSQ